MIYFVQGSNGLVKIGTTTNFKARLSGLTYHRNLKSPLTVLATMPGSYAEEFTLHEKFDHLRVRELGNPEIFHPAPDLMEFIQYVKTKHPQQEQEGKSKDPNKEQLVCPVDSTLHRKLRIAKAETSKSIAQIVTEALEQYLSGDSGHVTIMVTVHIHDSV